ncbi:hypothetical protein HK405_013242 [Cladochytrium tenue]|nr:hypothetical protein HK405_013242 [Cladochytrium tenue]
MDVNDHVEKSLTGSRYGTIRDHCTIRLNAPGGEVNIGTVRDHTIITGECAKLTISTLENHSKVCVTGDVYVGAQEDHCDVQDNKTMGQVEAYRAENERPGNPGL